MRTPASSRVAVVDDEENIRETVAFALRREGYDVETFSDGQSALEAFKRGLPDVVVLDILLPGMDGLELCRALRQISEQLPIIFLTSRDDEIDRVVGLELGADDYLCKPFSMRELVARIRVLLRRAALLRTSAPSPDEKILRVGDLRLDLDRYQAFWKQTPVALTVTEFMMLRALAQRPGVVKTRQHLMTEGYPDDTYVSERTIDSHMKRLRKKFAAVDSQFDAIETVYGAGYRFVEKRSSTVS
ncbi:MAG: response regulator transcription factor [Acidobacteriota bacterium]